MGKLYLCAPVVIGGALTNDELLGGRGPLCRGEAVSGGSNSTSSIGIRRFLWARGLPVDGGILNDIVPGSSKRVVPVRLFGAKLCTASESYSVRVIHITVEVDTLRGFHYLTSIYF